MQLPKKYKSHEKRTKMQLPVAGRVKAKQTKEMYLSFAVPFRCLSTQKTVKELLMDADPPTPRY